MNAKELGIFTALKNPNIPENFRITDEGTKLYVVVYGMLACFDGVGLDKMGAQELNNFIQKNVYEFKCSL